jgi:hypothetical protein
VIDEGSAKQELVDQALMMTVSSLGPSQASSTTVTRNLYPSGSYLELLKNYRDAAEHEWQGQLL